MSRDIRSADFILTDSECTRRKLSDLGLVDPEHSLTAYLGVCSLEDIEEQPSDPAVARLLDRDYVLFVGRLENRKNIGHIVEAVAPLRSLHLVVVGEPGFGYSENVRPKLATFPSHRLHVLSRLPQPDLVRLYSKAKATLLPSWEEGFGLPVLEAMINGSPVITSNRSATAEIATSGAILVEPADPQQTRIGIERLIQDEAFRRNLIDSGTHHAGNFTWSNYYDRVLLAYSSTLAR
jgi:glycosyltransferase involved in cell wall biosynthesis